MPFRNEAHSIVGPGGPNTMTDWYRYTWSGYIRYLGGLLVFLVVSSIGFWLILRAIRGENQFLNGLLNVPSWLLIATGIVLQGPLVGYVYLGIRAGFY